MSGKRNKASPKRDFARAYLTLNPAAELPELLSVWTESGHEGSISRDTINHARRQMGTSRGSGGKRPRLNAVYRNGMPEPPATPPPNRSGAGDGLPALLLELEEGLDALLFRVMGAEFSHKENVEGFLRSARRQVIYASKDL